MWDGGQGPFLPTGQVTQDGPPDPQVYVDLLNVNSSPGEFSTCFTELQKKFVKRCPAKLKNLLRLVKHWYKQVRGCPAPPCPHSPHPLPGTPLPAGSPPLSPPRC